MQTYLLTGAKLWGFSSSWIKGKQLIETFLQVEHTFKYLPLSSFLKKVVFILLVRLEVSHKQHV